MIARTSESNGIYMRELTKQIIKQVVFTPRSTHLAYMHFKMAILKAKMDKIERDAGQLGINLIGPSEFPSVNLERYDACHIIGSGWSLADSIHFAKRSDAYVVGFNFACLADIHFDSYFVEFGGPACAGVANAQVRALDRFVTSADTNIYFKNLWESKNEIGYAHRLYGNRVQFVRDLLVGCFDPRHLNDSALLLLKEDNRYLHQYSSTALTAIAFAKSLGFKRVVLHGVDFGGSYFFDLPAYARNADFRPPKDTSVAYSASTRAGKVHITSSSKIGVRQILPCLRDVLANMKIELFTGAERSPSAKILSVYN